MHTMRKNAQLRCAQTCTTDHWAVLYLKTETSALWRSSVSAGAARDAMGDHRLRRGLAEIALMMPYVFEKQGQSWVLADWDGHRYVRPRCPAKFENID